MLEKNSMSNKNLPPVNVPKDELKAMCKECCGEDLKGCAMDEYSWCPLLQYKKQKAAKRPVLSEAERARRSERMKAVLARKAS